MIEDTGTRPRFWQTRTYRRRRPLRMLLRRAWLLLALVAAAPFLLTLAYAAVPPVSTLMLARWATLRPVERQWVPIEQISPQLVRAVLTSEDSRFCLHGGVDWAEISKVLDADGVAGASRGASTIAMQIAKNLYLWPGAPYLRKPAEIVLAQWIDLTWTKRRQMEVYLNVAEWGRGGVFGAEAGARAAFGKSAAELTRREAALMATALPNPVARNPGRPGRGHGRLAGTISARMPATPLECVGVT